MINPSIPGIPSKKLRILWNWLLVFSNTIDSTTHRYFVELESFGTFTIYAVDDGTGKTIGNYKVQNAFGGLFYQPWVIINICSEKFMLSQTIKYKMKFQRNFLGWKRKIKSLYFTLYC